MVLATELTEELIREGLARELVRTIQDRRKEMGCEFTDRIAIGIVTDSAELQGRRRAIPPTTFSGETLAVKIVLGLWRRRADGCRSGWILRQIVRSG